LAVRLDPAHAIHKRLDNARRFDVTSMGAFEQRRRTTAPRCYSRAEDLSVDRPVETMTSSREKPNQPGAPPRRLQPLRSGEPLRTTGGGQEADRSLAQLSEGRQNVHAYQEMFLAIALRCSGTSSACPDTPQSETQGA
jgi:hypothetical protein